MLRKEDEKYIALLLYFVLTDNLLSANILIYFILQQIVITEDGGGMTTEDIFEHYHFYSCRMNASDAKLTVNNVYKSLTTPMKAGKLKRKRNTLKKVRKGGNPPDQFYRPHLEDVIETPETITYTGKGWVPNTGEDDLGELSKDEQLAMILFEMSENNDEEFKAKTVLSYVRNKGLPKITTFKEMFWYAEHIQHQPEDISDETYIESLNRKYSLISSQGGFLEFCFQNKIITSDCPSITTEPLQNVFIRDPLDLFYANQESLKLTDGKSTTVYSNNTPLVIILLLVLSITNFLFRQNSESRSRFREPLKQLRRKLKETKLLEDESKIMRRTELNRYGDRNSSASRRIIASRKEHTNTVVILISCHGAYKLNDDDSIDEVPFPKNKTVEIVKSAKFGCPALSDFILRQRLFYYQKEIKKRLPPRFNEDEVRKRLRSYYYNICFNIRNVRSRKTIEERSVYKSVLEDIDKEYGAEGKGVFVDKTFSHVPFLQKVYKLDEYDKDEIGRGVIFMFPYKGQQLATYNLHTANEFKDLRYLLGLKDAANEAYEEQKAMDREYEITTYDILALIYNFPEEYKHFKILDDSCGGFDQRLSEERKQKILDRYQEQMISSNPTEFKGGKNIRTRRRNRI